MDNFPILIIVLVALVGIFITDLAEVIIDSFSKRNIDKENSDGTGRGDG